MKALWMIPQKTKEKSQRMRVRKKYMIVTMKSTKTVVSYTIFLHVNLIIFSWQYIFLDIIFYVRFASETNGFVILL